jgi:hypothetical protein
VSEQTRFTPGPWTVEHNDDGPHLLPGIKAGTYWIASPHRMPGMLANCHLIAAAPDLLAALTAIMVLLDGDAFLALPWAPGSTLGQAAKVVKQAQRAIEQATGSK